MKTIRSVLGCALMAVAASCDGPSPGASAADFLLVELGPEYLHGRT
jgi:hypothetical protein